VADRSGLYVRPDGSRYFLDVDCEERWIQSMVQSCEFDHAEYERQEELWHLTLESLGEPEEDPDPPPRGWRRRGLMMSVAEKEPTDAE